MNKQTFIILCETYKEYNKIHHQILNALNIYDDNGLGAVITPIQEALYRIIDIEFSEYSENNRDYLIESIEDLIYGEGFYLNIEEEQIYISSFSELYDTFINNALFS